MELADDGLSSQPDLNQLPNLADADAAFAKLSELRNNRPTFGENPAQIAILPFLEACAYIFRFSILAEKGGVEGFSVQPYLDLNNSFFWRSAWVTIELATIGTLSSLHARELESLIQNSDTAM
ncbi:hypothetical protein AB9F29_18015 [Falsihalocynthiibacter sp. S25ZX9]|uniref:hypothetical protein n=1 Tax=Falsihalocynthiibacter sp. S25ZX9 TaxID=3240870 RepID=UPI003510AA12